jgi:hypothetical protein
MAYAHTLDAYEASMDSDIEEKYALWAGNGWRNNLETHNQLEILIEKYFTLYEKQN